MTSGSTDAFSDGAGASFLGEQAASKAVGATAVKSATFTDWKLSMFFSSHLIVTGIVPKHRLCHNWLNSPNANQKRRP